MRRGLWLLFGGLGVTATVSVAGIYLLARTFWDFPAAEAELPSALAAYRRDGLPFVAADLRLPKLGRADNAAPIVREAVAAMPKGVTDDDLLKAIRAGNPEPVIEKFGPALAKLAMAAKIPNANFERDWDLGPKLEFLEYRPMKTLAKVLAARAERSSKRGDDVSALRDLSLVRRMGEWAGQEPSMLSMLVRIGLELIALGGEERCLAHGAISNERLARYRAWLEQKGALPKWGDALRGEAFMGVATYRNFTLFGGRKTFSETVPEDEIKIDPRTLRREGLPTGRTECGFLARHLQIWDETYQATGGFRQEPLEMSRRFKAITRRWESKRGLSTSLVPTVFSVLDSTGVAIVRLQARRQTTRGLLDALAIRNKTGAWPKAIGETDPFDGKPLRIKLDGDRLRIYSVGRNGRDEGGKLAREVQGAGAKPDDVASIFPPLAP